MKNALAISVGNALHGAGLAGSGESFPLAPTDEDFFASLTHSLIPEIGVDDYIFDRNDSDAVLQDFEPLFKQLTADEFRPTGARNARNQCPALDIQAAWSETFIGGSVISTYGVADPDGGNNAVHIVGTGVVSFASLSQGLAIAGQHYTNRIAIKLNSALTGSQLLNINNCNLGGGDVIANASLNNNVGVWQELSGVQGTETATAGASMGMALLADSSPFDITIALFQYEDTTDQADKNPSPFISVGVGTSAEFQDNSDMSVDDTTVTGGTGFTWANSEFEISSGKLQTNAIFKATSSTTEVVVGKLYALSYTIAGFDLLLINMAGSGVLPATIGKHSVVIRAVTTDKLTIICSDVSSTLDDISIKEIDHGSNADGVKNFPRSNGNTVASTVIIEALGKYIPPSILKGALIEGLRTNYADDDDDLSGGAETIDLTPGGTGDYTLSVEGTAAVTVAAGTATGTGFGQATEGFPVTFNLSVVGTVTLTLDSGSLLIAPNGQVVKQVEKGSFASSWIPTSGAAADRKAETLKYPIENISDVEGSLRFTFIPMQTENNIRLFSAAEAGGAALYIEQRDSGAVRVFYGFGAGTQGVTSLNFVTIGAESEVRVRWGTTLAISVDGETWVEASFIPPVLDFSGVTDFILGANQTDTNQAFINMKNLSLWNTFEGAGA